MRWFFGICFTAFCLFSLASCTVKYKFTGASYSSQVKTVSIKYFQNRASLVQPSLSQTFTDALIDKCRNQTNLKFTTEIGDVNFEGEIVDYNTKPVTVGADAQAATNRFSITVHVKFTNAIQPEFSFDKQISRYKDYSSNLDLSAVESELSKEIVDMIVEDIFNQAFVNW
ncbi:MAG TPA: LptE family protein [Bacteroidales bacterium]|nr:LptE family protein [Bacteroidales bacterium]